jgi:hypothetical protein
VDRWVMVYREARLNLCTIYGSDPIQTILYNEGKRSPVSFFQIH